MKRTKNQSHRDKTFAKNILVSKMQEHLNSKTTHLKGSKNPNRHNIRKDTQTENNHMKRVSILLVIKENKNQITNAMLPHV